MDLRPPAARLPEPVHVPGLHLERILGRGGHAEVWEAVDVGSGERVAVKLRRAPAPAEGSGPAARGRPRGGGRDDGLADDGGGVPEAAERLAREIALLRRIDHPHVVRLRRVLDLPDGSRAMVLDHAAGGSLAALVRSRGRLRPGEVSTLLIALARALADLHGRGLVHGDLSPGNVLFTGDGRPLLSDLGLASVLGADPQEATWGTPGFIDPASLPAGDPARDVWGLGAVAWFALTGRPPAGPLDDDPDRRNPGGDAPVARADRADGGPEAGGLPAAGVHPGAVPVGELLQARDAARRATLLRLIRDCLAQEPGHRPDPADLARRAWRAVPPAPVRLVPAAGSPVAGLPAAGLPAAGLPAAGLPAAGLPAAGGQSESADGSDSVAGLVSGGAAWQAVTGPRPLAGPADPSGGPAWAASPAVPAGDAVGTAFVDVTRRIREQATRVEPKGAASRRPGRRLAVGAAAVLAVLAVGAGLLASGRLPVRLPGATAGGAPAPRSSATGDASASGAPALCVAADPSSAELARAVCALARGRAAAFAVPSTVPLATVDEPGSAALTSDEALVRRLQGQGLRLSGVSFAVTEVRVVARTSTEATVTASVGTSAHQQVRADGSVAAQVPAQAPRQVRLVLVSRTGPPGWWVRSVEGG
jgi:eukaryotic-like serine/threonine-protein kinase